MTKKEDSILTDKVFFAEIFCEFWEKVKDASQEKPFFGHF
jgi:hypothetical protein